MLSRKEFINKYTGVVADVPWGFKGECVSLVQRYVNEVYGVEMKARGNAKDYGYSLVREGHGHYVDTPTYGDIVVWGSQLGSGYGHIGIFVENGKIFDQNHGGQKYGGIRTMSSVKPLHYVRMNKSPKPDVTLLPLDDIAKKVINGEYGNGQDRISRLTTEGYDAVAVQRRVNELLAPKENSKPVESITEIAHRVINGDYGNGGERNAKLKSDGYDPVAVQNRVNEILAPKPPRPSNEEIARRVINGDYGNGQSRFNKFRAEGYDPNEIQKIVNRLLG